MKYYTFVFLLTILFVNSELLFSQKTKSAKYNLQLNLGVSNTLHYNRPVNLNFGCFEGCFPEEQNSRITPNVDFNIYRILNQNNSLKIGFGVSSYRYWERGQEGDGGGGLAPYESIKRWSFYGLSIGYRYIFYSEKKVNLFIENDFVYEIPIDDNRYITNGFAIQPKIGAIIKFNSNWSFIAHGFYKTSLTEYSETGWGKEYKPYAYGVQLGINLKI
jgi:hypothetical protein